MDATWLWLFVLIARVTHWDHRSCLIGFSLPTRPALCSREDKESIGPNGGQIGAWMREKRAKQNCGLCRF
ncbi:hypothetical protein LINPERPRIM_LOCUS743 [Linum perenne]